MTENNNQEELTTRQQDILGILVREYVHTAQPVGSLVITQKYGLAYSSATVRNELAYLEEVGYLSQPHTSAGRLPTEKGYRYFVARLMDEAELPVAERTMIRHQFHQVRMDLDQWMRLAAAVLAHTSQSAALVTSPYTPQARLKHVKLVSVSDQMCLLVLVLYGGTVRQDMITLTRQTLQDEMEMVANKLNAFFQGLDTDQIAESHQPIAEGLEQQVQARILGMMREEEKHRSITLYRDGLTNVLQQPEFGAVEKARHIVQMLEERDRLESVLMEASSQSGVQVIIGGEGRWQDLEDYSMILARYGVAGHSSGALGVLGPIRMPYRRAVSAVRYVSHLLSELIVDLYGNDQAD